MRDRIKISFLAIAVLFTVISSCKKEPGDGGQATIHGKVYAYKTTGADSGYKSGVNVYLSYGNHTWEDQNANSSYTGEYAFPFLHTGDYTVWILNKCDTCPLKQSYDVAHVSINKPRETVEVRDLINYY